MKLKQRPEDFSVKESFRFDEAPEGTWRVYLMDKQKLSTFEAVARVQQRFGLKPGSITYCGLKDKQGRTEQLIAVNGHDVELQDPDLRLKYLGRSEKPLSAANITSNRFAVTVRRVRQSEVQQLTIAAAEVNRLGVINYFDSQRFGSLKHGQGFIAKDLIRGDFEAALHNYLAVPSPLDRTDDAKVKAFWAEHWGDWTARCPFDANRKYIRILKALRDEPTDFVTAFLQIDSDYRALILFTYQSYLWNETARRLLQLVLPREHLFPMPYQAGTLLHHRDAAPEVLRMLKTATVPLLAPNSPVADPRVQEAVVWVLGREKLKLEQLRIELAPRLLYFRHEERKLTVIPQKLVVGRPRPDELNRDFTKVNIAFTLPPGSYATLVVKRLFHFGLEDDDHQTALEAAAEKARAAPQGAPTSPRRPPAGPRANRRGPVRRPENKLTSRT
jgi:tRNA pseudouridine13 synthase